MKMFDTFASTDARVNRKVNRAFRGVVTVSVTVLLLFLYLGRADA